MNVYLLPMISPSKKVVRLGWSSVRPVDYGQFASPDDMTQPARHPPLMRRYPHINDSRMSTCLISTSTSYCWRSEVWLPLNRLPGRRRDDEVLGRNYDPLCQQLGRAHDLGKRADMTYSTRWEGRGQMVAKRQRGRGRNRARRSGRERGRLRGALLCVCIVCRRHRGGYVSRKDLPLCASRLAVCIRTHWRVCR